MTNNKLEQTSSEKFQNLASKMQKSPSLTQGIREYLASLFGAKIVDTKFFHFLQETEEKVNNIIK